jgi:hypothetical protein
MACFHAVWDAAQTNYRPIFGRFSAVFLTHRVRQESQKIKGFTDADKFLVTVCSVTS